MKSNTNIKFRKQEFYTGLFPTWTWRPATAENSEEKLAMFTMGGDVGGRSPLFSSPLLSPAFETMCVKD